VRQTSWNAFNAQASLGLLGLALLCVGAFVFAANLKQTDFEKRLAAAESAIRELRAQAADPRSLRSRPTQSVPPSP
jgi:hypothetical protein